MSPYWHKWPYTLCLDHNCVNCITNYIHVACFQSISHCHPLWCIIFKHNDDYRHIWVCVVLFMFMLSLVQTKLKKQQIYKHVHKLLYRTEGLFPYKHIIYKYMWSSQYWLLKQNNIYIYIKFFLIFFLILSRSNVKHMCNNRMPCVLIPIYLDFGIWNSV